MTPENALARFERDEIVMMTPTVRMLRCLAMFDSAAAVLEAASAGLPDERVRVKYEGGDRSKYTIVLPGEEGYDAADEERENGWIRLRPLAGLR